MDKKIVLNSVDALSSLQLKAGGILGLHYYGISWIGK